MFVNYSKAQGNYPRRIAMLSVHTCPLAMLGGKKTGGMNVYVRDLSRELGRQGILVDVFTRSQDECQPRVKHDLGYGGRVIHIPAGPEHPLPVDEVAHYISEFAAGVLAFSRAENIQYDVIHSHYWISGLVAEQLKKTWRNVPVVQMFHTLGHMKNRIALNDTHRASAARIWGETHVIRHVADRIVAATPAEQAQLQWLYGADMGLVSVVPPGVDLARFNPVPQAEAKAAVGMPPQHKNILFVGRIEPLKGVDTLLEAIAHIRERDAAVIEHVCVAIIGGDPWADTLEAEMARLQNMRIALGVEDLVTFVGSKDQNALAGFYAAAEMVVMPSHYESFGLVALEAMAMGTPVIASEVGGLAYLIQDGRTGYHVPSRDARALADRIYALLVDKGLRDRLGRQARAHAERYNWEFVARELIAEYKQCKPQISYFQHAKTCPIAPLAVREISHECTCFSI